MTPQAKPSEPPTWPTGLFKLSLVAFIALVALAGLHFFALQTEQAWAPELRAPKILVFVTFQVLLGLSARQSGRSFLLYGGASVIPPLLGGAVALANLWWKLRQPMPTPSVDPTNCGKPQSAAHLER